MFVFFVFEVMIGVVCELLDVMKCQFGCVFNFYVVMVYSFVVLQGYFDFCGVLQQGVLDLKMCECVVLLVVQFNDCDYCVVVYIFWGGKIGMDVDDLWVICQVDSVDVCMVVVLCFVKVLVLYDVVNVEIVLIEVLQVGWNEVEVGELVVYIVLNVFLNYFKQIVELLLDFFVVLFLEKVVV